MKLSPESSKRAEGHRPERPGPSWTPPPPAFLTRPALPQVRPPTQGRPCRRGKVRSERGAG